MSSVTWKIFFLKIFSLYVQWQLLSFRFLLIIKLVLVLCTKIQMNRKTKNCISLTKRNPLSIFWCWFLFLMSGYFDLHRSCPMSRACTFHPCSRREGRCLGAHSSRWVEVVVRAYGSCFLISSHFSEKWENRSSRDSDIGVENSRHLRRKAKEDITLSSKRTRAWVD